MDTALIESIVREVTARIEVLSHQEKVLVLAREKDVDPAKLEKYLQVTSGLVYLEQVAEDGPVLAEKEYDKVVLPCLSCSDMADLAVGRASGGVTAIILSLLLNGQCVEVIDFEYQSFVNSAPANLWNLYESYEKKLAGFGLIHCVPVTSPSIVLRKRLITEQDVIDTVAAGADKMTIIRGAMITPLAADAVRTHKLQIIKK